jgi:hypothetical protein
MRPITKPTLPDHAFGSPVSALLMQCFGEYCSVSEQPIPSANYAWSKAYRAEVTGRIARSGWNDVLLLSENSFIAQLGKTAAQLLFPDDPQQLTFNLAGPTPFVYELQTVTFVTVDKANREERRKGEAVIVKGQTDVATATIDYFDLNTQFFNAADNVFRIPLDVYLSGFDRRVMQRTEAWRIAAEYGAAILDHRIVLPDEEQLGPQIAQGQRLVAATGYWSTWAACLHGMGVGMTILRRLLLPFTQVATQIPWVIGPGPHNPYPGTNPKCIP